MNNFYTYELCSSATPTIPFYIGKGKGNRIYDHKNNALKQRHNNIYLQNKILKILREGNSIVYRKIVENVSEKEAFRWEIGRIVVLRIMGFKLCNFTFGGTGGDTFTNCPNKEQHKKRIAAALVGRVGIWRGKKRPNHSLIMKGRKRGNCSWLHLPHSEQHKENIRKARIGLAYSKIKCKYCERYISTNNMHAHVSRTHKILLTSSD